MTVARITDRLCTVKVGWFIVMFVNFVFGVSGVFICSYKLNTIKDEDVKINFFKLSMFFAVSNLLLSVLLLVSILKNSQRYAFLYAVLCFLSLFAATFHIESNTNRNTTFLILFTVFALLCFGWFCVHGAYQIIRKEKEHEDECNNGIAV
ncbi:uncharacterized protein LOC126264892 [Aethina tumida]|uniref:uncharacterized protein LOC126264892 n=1 Tax=Aethina tumida TaxID=116153 RepID=UPI0021485291|nr:uncharacterized protein LOC126264892 [Aethina tumida]